MELNYSGAYSLATLVVVDGLAGFLLRVAQIEV
jgi:hypothetical protein